MRKLEKTVLTLSIDQDSFERILSGEKKEEYREIKPYYTGRLNKCYDFTTISHLPIQDGVERPVLFKVGVSKKAPSFTANCLLRIDGGQEEWGAVPGEWYYVLSIRNIMEQE